MTNYFDTPNVFKTYINNNKKEVHIYIKGNF